MRLMLLASSAADVEHIRASKDLPRLASFDYEARRSARRRKRTAPAAAGSAPLGKEHLCSRSLYGPAQHKPVT